jgi:hypothetical protein
MSAVNRQPQGDVNAKEYIYIYQFYMYNVKNI